jgi:hypothetical protein
VTPHQIWATAVVVWLLGLFMAWCLGYATRDRYDPTRHSSLTGQLARARLERAAALEELDDLEHTRLHCDAHRAPAPRPAPVAVHVHLAAPLPWLAHPTPMPLDAHRFLDAMPVLPAEEVQS